MHGSFTPDSAEKFLELMREAGYETSALPDSAGLQTFSELGINAGATQGDVWSGNAADFGEVRGEYIENYDYTRCVRPNGTAYGTGGTCRKGTPAEKEEHDALSQLQSMLPKGEKIVTSSGKVFGSETEKKKPSATPTVQEITSMNRDDLYDGKAAYNPGTEGHQAYKNEIERRHKLVDGLKKRGMSDEEIEEAVWEREAKKVGGRGGSSGETSKTLASANVQPHEMSKEQYNSYRAEERRKAIEEWNKKGNKGLPPSGGDGTVSERIKLAEQAGLNPGTPEFISAATGDMHKLRVQAAITLGKTVPPNVLAEYPDLKEKVGGRGGSSGEIATAPVPSKPIKDPVPGILRSQAEVKGIIADRPETPNAIRDEMGRPLKLSSDRLKALSQEDLETEWNRAKTTSRKDSLRKEIDRREAEGKLGKLKSDLLSTPTRFRAKTPDQRRQTLREIEWLDKKIEEVKILMQKKPSKIRHLKDLERQKSERLEGLQ